MLTLSKAITLPDLEETHCRQLVNNPSLNQSKTPTNYTALENTPMVSFNDRICEVLFFQFNFFHLLD